jgi:hypothetical protein
VLFIADAPAHGRQFGEHQNHKDEASKLLWFIVRVAQAQIFVRALDPNVGADLGFREFERVYEEMRGPSFTHEFAVEP